MPAAPARVLHWKPQPDPERVRVRLAQVTVDENRQGGWTFGALAQVYGVVNDRLMIFRPGSGKKTIRERVKTGRVKIHDGHPWSPTSKSTVGVVLAAEEKPEGVFYTGFLSATEYELARKMIEGIVDENSLEIYVLREGVAEVEIEDVPELSRRWCDMTPKGKAQVREIKEWAWLAIGLLGASSQGIASIVEPPTIVPYQDLPIFVQSGSAWEPEAAASRIAAWASDPAIGGVNSAKLSRAFLARGKAEAGRPTYLGQIADVVDGELVVIPGALEGALAELEEHFAGDPATLAAIARTVGRYEGRLTEAGRVPQDLGSIEAQEDGAPSASAPPPAAEEPSEQPTLSRATAGPAHLPPTGTADDVAAEERHAILRGLRMGLLELGGPEDEPDRAGAEPPP